MFDSGVGGLTVLNEVRQILPQESIYYLADTARIPYGEKSREAIIRYSIENVRFLIEKGIKLLIVACNTASAHALSVLQAMFDIPIVGVIESGAEKAVRITKNKRIAVLGTRGTISSGIYQKEICERLDGAKVIALACPLLVPLIEEKLFSHAATKMIVQEYLSSLKEQQIDTLLLGCTHYPLLTPLFREELGEGVSIVDSASTCAETVLTTLQKMQLQVSQNAIPKYCYFVSDDPHKFQALGRELLGFPIEDVLSVDYTSDKSEVYEYR